MTTVTVHPTSQAYASHAATIVGGATTYGVTSDGSNSSWMQGQAANMYVNLWCGSYTLASNEKCRSVTPRITASRDGTGGSTQDTQFMLYLNSPDTNSVRFMVTRAGTAISTSTGPAVLIRQDTHLGPLNRHGLRIS